MIAEYDNGAAVTSPSHEYIYAGSQLVAKVEAGATNYFHPDHLSTRVNTDSSGNVSRTFGQYPFGEVWYENTSTSKLKFTTYERDAESGNDFALARSYINRYGRFSSPDPLSGSLADPQSLNRFAYSRNDPIDFMDPLGLDCTGRWFGGGVEVTCDPIGVPTGGGGSGGPGGLVSGAQINIHCTFGVTNGPNTICNDPNDGRGNVDFDNLRSQALVALLNPDCANLFGGFPNAARALFGSSYSMYTPGMSNPFPSRITDGAWNRAVTSFTDPTTFGRTIWRSSVPGGATLFGNNFSSYDPGFPSSQSGFSQMTGFFHELEHSANHSNKVDETIDSDYDADFKKINKNCTPKKIETETAPIPGEIQ